MRSLLSKALAVASLAAILLLLWASPGAAEAPSDFEDPLAGLAALADESLAEARGGMVLPNGMTIEVLGTMRVLVDGDELAASGAMNLATPQIVSNHAHGTIVNSLNNVSLEQYREINFFISNMPLSTRPANFVPPPVLPNSIP